MKHVMMLVVFLCVVATPCWAGFKEGEDAYERRDYATALREFLPLAEQGDARAQFNLGRLYNLGGQGVSQDYFRAFIWFHRAAEQGHAFAQAFLGDMYYRGHQGVVPQNYTEAAKWYRRAAEQGLADVEFRLGEMYYHGQGVPQNYAQAFQWYRRVAEWGGDLCPVSPWRDVLPWPGGTAELCLCVLLVQSGFRIFITWYDA